MLAAPLWLAGCVTVEPDSGTAAGADPVLWLQDREPARVLADFPIGEATRQDLLNTLSAPHERRAGNGREEWIYIGTRPGGGADAVGHYIVSLRDGVVRDLLWTGGGPCEGFSAREIQSGERSC